MMAPRLSIVIVSFHSRADLARCLPSIARQGIEGVEVVVVDNAPGDGTAAWLTHEHPSVRLVTNATNTGYAGGNNLGIEHARGEHVLILNPDTELHDDALRTLLDAVRAHPDALVTPKLLQPDGTVNACGNQMHATGITSSCPLHFGHRIASVISTHSLFHCYFIFFTQNACRSYSR